MDHDGSTAPDRREFVRRLGTAAAYGVPVFAALGVARPAAGAVLGADAESESNPEEILRHLQTAARSLNAANRLGSRYRFQRSDWEIMEPGFKGLEGPMKNWPPDWCAIC